MSMNFGPSFVYKPDVGAFNGVSEVQPMSPADRKVTPIFLSYIIFVLVFVFILYLVCHRYTRLESPPSDRL